jgi:GNAT superfamily N-acetyltransferase
VIRAATRDDIPRIVEMAEQFYATTAYPAFAPLAKESAAGLAIVMIETGVMLVAEIEGRVVGMVGLFVEPFTFNVAVTVATEIVWWVDPDAQGAGVGRELLAAIEPACKERGADVVRMMCLASSPPQAAALYERMGYAPSEHAFTKRLEVA